MTIKNNPKIQNFINWLKFNFKFILIGCLVVIAITVGFFVALALLLLVPVIRWFLVKNADKFEQTTRKTSKKADYVEVEYEIIDEKPKKNKK